MFNLCLVSLVCHLDILMKPLGPENSGIFFSYARAGTSMSLKVAAGEKTAHVRGTRTVPIYLVPIPVPSLGPTV